MFRPSTSRHSIALVFCLGGCAWFGACAVEETEAPPFGEGLADGMAADEETSAGPSSEAAGPTTNVASAASGGTPTATSGASGGTPSATSGGTTGSMVGATANPLGGTQTGDVGAGGMGASAASGGGVTSGGVTSAGATSGGTTGGRVTSGGATSGGATTTRGGGMTSGGAGTMGGGATCTNVRPTGTDWDEATCAQWASETMECNEDWMVDGNYCNQSCGRCTAAPFGGG